MSKLNFRKIDLIFLGAAIGSGIILGPIATNLASSLWKNTNQPMVAQAAGNLSDAFQASEKPEDTFICTPVGVAVFDQRVHVRCLTAAPGGIVYFAVSTSDSKKAARFLSVMLSAKAQGKNLAVYYDPNVLGTAFGCGSFDCRPASGMEIQQ